MRARLNTINTLISLALFTNTLIFNVSVTFADEPEKTEKVVVTGTGENPTTARQDAIRNAVEQVVGTFINAETMVRDSALISDEILTFSGGYVKESRILSTKVDGNLVSIKLEALVISTKLKRKIEALNIATKKIDRGSLFGEAFSKARAVKSGNEWLEKVLVKYPQAAYKIELGKPKIGTINHTTNKAQVKVAVNLSFDDQWIAELESVLKAVAYKELSNVDISLWGHTLDPVSNSGQVNEDSLVFLVSKTQSMLSRDIVNKAYFVNIGRAVLEDGTKSINGLASEYSGAHTVAIVELLDSSNNTLDVIKTSFYDRHAKVDNFSSAGARPLVLQADYAQRIGRIKDILLISNYTLSFGVDFEVDISLLEKVASMKASFEPFNSNK